MRTMMKVLESLFSRSDVLQIDGAAYTELINLKYIFNFHPLVNQSLFSG